jgi:uncharacterized protein (DUF934 family)
VLVDMLPLLRRCGFDALQLRHGQRSEDAVRALGFFSSHYQGDVRQPRPAFAREPSAEAVVARAAQAADLLAARGNRP